MALFIILIAAFLVAFLLLKKPSNVKQKKLTTHNENKKRPSSFHPYAAVEVVASIDCCEAINSHLNKRYLSGEAPSLPLNQCSNAQCTCIYKHYEDRRNVEGDRRSPIKSLQEELFEQTGNLNRRLKKERRKSHYA